MKTISVIAATLLSFTSLVTAGVSQPFHLALSSGTNSTYNGTILEACDVGGARTAICARGATTANGTTAKNIFRFDLISTGGTGLAATGLIQWTRIGTSTNTTYNMGFTGQSSSNVVTQELKTGAPYAGYASWNDKNQLDLPDLYDDTINRQRSTSVPTGYYRWQICDKTLLAGSVPALSWQLGKYAPQNPTCQPVTVTRQYV